MKKGDDAYYYHTNHLGSIIAMTNSNNEFSGQISYDAYGSPSHSDDIFDIGL